MSISAKIGVFIFLANFIYPSVSWVYSFSANFAFFLFYMIIHLIFSNIIPFEIKGILLLCTFLHHCNIFFSQSIPLPESTSKPMGKYEGEDLLRSYIASIALILKLLFFQIFLHNFALYIALKILCSLLIPFRHPIQLFITRNQQIAKNLALWHKVQNIIKPLRSLFKKFL